MGKGLVVFDRQHAGRPKPSLGAGVDLDGDGQVELHEREANLTPFYIAAATAELEAQGYDVALIDPANQGEVADYPERWTQANELASGYDGPVAYLACHLNAGGGDYACALYDQRSGGGKSLAGAVMVAMRQAELPGVKRALPRSCYDDRHSKVAGRWVNANGDPAWLYRAFNTIKGIYSGPANVSGICLEPLFVDTHQHLLDEDGLAQVGRAVADGLAAWLG